MEQTVNTWNKGLQMDTHPMVLSNDTLSDALNATFVTMNGNEVILLNDMGNRRVDNAFLPPGYLPVGMKEYGGIIYVAAYNPITDKSQIGSFPSPEKKISKMDDESLGGTFDFSSFLSSSNVSHDDNLDLDVIHKDSFMIPLTGDSVLRAGDKFAVYASGLSLMRGLITNYNNIDGISNDDLRAFTPKNKMYTLQLGILNSQNEFVDITKSLCRWESSGGEWYPVTFNLEVSDVYKFNYGYFIPDGFTNPDLSETANDSNFIRERLKIAANTYAYKLIGPLYLKVIYNHIENFNYNIYGIKSENETTLTIEGYITYNCPDNSYRLLDDLGNEYYNDLETGVAFTNVDDLVFDFYHDGSLLSVEETSGRISNVSYNQNTNLYSLKIVKKYIIPLTEGIYEYTIGVLADNLTHNDQTLKIYLKGLSVKGSIDLSLLGSGTAKVNGWRFYNNLEKETTTLTVSFDAYPEYGKHFGGLYFKFNPGKDGNNGIIFDNNSPIRYPEEGELPLYNGKQTFNFSWNKRFKSKTLYQVTAYYNIYSNETGELIGNTLILESVLNPDDIDQNTGEPRMSNYRWFLTTELFNEFYQPSSGIDDFCNLGTIAGYVPIQSIISEGVTPPPIQKAFIDKMIISLEATNKVSNDSTKDNDIFEGDLTSTTNDINYTCKHLYTVNINTSSEIKIIDEELYPDFIFVNPDKKDKILIDGYSVIKIGDTIINEYTLNDYDTIFKRLLSTNEGKNITFSITDFKDLTELGISLHSSDKNISGHIEYWDRYRGYSQTGISNVENVFDSLYTLLGKDIKPKNIDNLTGTFGGIFVNFDSRNGPDDGHFIDVYMRQPHYNSLDGSGYPDDSTLHDGGLRVYENWHDGAIEANFKNIKDSVFLYFNVETNPGLIFIYLAIPRNHGHKCSNSRTRGSGIEELNSQYIARVWWKASDSEWALFDELYAIDYTYGNETGDPFLNYLRKLFKEDRIYCMYDLYPNEILGIYATDTNRIFYNEFSVPLILGISYGIGNTSVSEILHGLGTIYGTNLWFLGNSNMPNINPSTVEFELNSSKIFQEKVNGFEVSSIKNVDLTTGLRYDINGNELNRNYMYKYVNTIYKRSDIPEDDSTYQIVGSKDYKNAYGVNDYQGYKIIIWIIKQSIYEADSDFDLNGKYYETRVTEKRAYRLKYYNPRGGATVPDVNDPWKYLNDGVRVPVCDEPTVTENRIPRQVPGNGKNLVRIDNNYIKVDSDNKISTNNGDINTVVYNRKDTIGTPQYRFDHCGNDGDSHTILDYTLTNIVRL